MPERVNRIARLHGWKYAAMIMLLGFPALQLIAVLDGRRALSTFDFIVALALAAGIVLGAVPLFRVANLTIDTVARTYVCWWGFLVPLRTISGRFDDIVGLEVRTHAWWEGQRPHRVYLHTRAAEPFIVDARNELRQAHQEAGWLARDLDTKVL